MVIFLIILGIIFYLFIAWSIFRISSANDLFNEFSGRRVYEFPTLTFVFSIFWVLSLPFMAICALFSWIADEIETWGYAYYEIGRMKNKQKKENKNREE